MTRALGALLAAAVAYGAMAAAPDLPSPVAPSSTTATR